MPVSMFTVKIERSNAVPTNAVRPSAVMIATSESAIGTSPATTVPKTRSRTISATGSPNCSSPFFRSSCESCWKSRSTDHSPVAKRSKVSSSSAWATSRTLSAASSSEMPTPITAARLVSASGRSDTCWTSGVRRSSPTTRANFCRLSSVVAESERMSTRSVVNSGSGGRRSPIRSYACSDSGLFSCSASPERASPRNSALSATETTTAAIQTATVRPGFRADATTSFCMSVPPRAQCSWL